jgi:phenylalanyl-tRNA synthetase alpha chain
MQDTLEKLVEEARSEIAQAKSDESLNQVSIKFLGKTGSITQVLKGLKDLTPDERKRVGQIANQSKSELEALIKERAEQLLDTADGVDFDITLPGHTASIGAIHPVTRMKFELNDAFHSIGFEIYEGPDISSELYDFDFLNFPPDHPARESMDTYWLKGFGDRSGAERVSLRPHLTGASVRYLQAHKPPCRFVYPGRVYRNESTDAGHERAFYQYEALIVDKHVPFTSGKLLVNTILERVFGREVKTRMRAGFFPFVEPGFEIDMQCLVCEGKGCSVCKRSGWVEVMPGGAPHPNVLKSASIDPDVWMGFYINIGLDRLVMMKHAIDDIRLLHSGDLRFLRQFS